MSSYNILENVFGFGLIVTKMQVNLSCS